MFLEVIRFSSQKNSTLGLLFDVTTTRKFLCYTLEDQHQVFKVDSKTRIPADTYTIGLRTEGGFHQRYKERFGSMHKGMLHILNVPNFQWILIHCGNTDADTAGCLLVGNSSTQNIIGDGSIGDSTNAYKRIYPPIANAILNGETVKITFVDYDMVVGD